MPQLTEFEGRWRIARRIEDEWMGTTGLFEGVARFSRDARGLGYQEVGELKLPQEAPMAASRRYLWRDEPGGIAVLYEDGRFFHRIRTGATVVQDWHVCGGDEYDVTYNFTHWPDWRMIWKVRGPRKDYLSISDFTRL
jgi:Family of unknown function (DUF6314)